MLESLPLQSAKYVVELGPGTGVFTRQLLKHIPEDGQLVAFEINQNFTNYLERNFHDSRLEVITTCAGTAGEKLRIRGWDRVDVVVASLGFGMMSDAKGHEIFSGLAPFMGEDSIFTLFQYVHQVKYFDGRFSRFDISHLLAEHFSHINRRIVWRNLPPAFVFDCRV